MPERKLLIYAKIIGECDFEEDIDPTMKQNQYGPVKYKFCFTSFEPKKIEEKKEEVLKFSIKWNQQ